MRKEDIKVGHIYYVDFNPTRKGEFDREHLAVVLKKNRNEVTFIVIPLTGSDVGVGENKIELNVTNQLPFHLRKKKTYAVYDQIRTLSASRFHQLYEGDVIIDSIVPEDEMDKLYEVIITNLLEDVKSDRKYEIIKSCLS